MLKVGDKVRINLSLGDPYTSEVLSLNGKLATVVFRHNNGRYYIDIDDNKYIWNEYELEYVKSKPTVVVNIKNDVVQEVISNLDVDVVVDDFDNISSAARKKYNNLMESDEFEIIPLKYIDDIRK